MLLHKLAQSSWCVSESSFIVKEKVAFFDFLKVSGLETRFLPNSNKKQEHWSEPAESWSVWTVLVPEHSLPPYTLMAAAVTLNK